MSPVNKKAINNKSSHMFIFSLLLFSVFAILACLFPYSGDDWAWGSEIGAERLENWFEGYNGRYAGNLLVMTLTRSKALCVAVMALCFVLTGFLPSVFAGAKRITPFALGTVLLLIIPGDVFAQSIVWTSGFSNYVPPALLTLLYFILTKNIFGDEPLQRQTDCNLSKNRKGQRCFFHGKSGWMARQSA